MSDRILLFLLGVSLLLQVTDVEGKGRPYHRKQQIQRDAPQEDSCEDEVDADIRKSQPKVGSVRKQLQNDEGDGVEDPTDDDYLRYEDKNQDGICILERQKCPAGDWQMFTRKTEKVCLKMFGSRMAVDAVTASRECRKHANSRLMLVDNDQERQWIYNQPLARNGSYYRLLLGAYRNRKCHVTPWNCKDIHTGFTSTDGTVDTSYIFTKWYGGGTRNSFTIGPADNCLAYMTEVSETDHVNQITDSPCNDMWHVYLCGITVM